jgi:hypothetical protein
MRRGDAGGQEGLGRLWRLDGEQGFHDPVGGRDAVWFREVPVGVGIGGEAVEVVGEGGGGHVGLCLEGGL